MKSVIALLIIGALTGAYFINKHHVDKLAEVERLHQAAIIERDKITHRLSNEYYKLSKKADDRASTPIPDRVLVKTQGDCVRTTTNASVGNGTDATRVELDREVVRRVAELGDKHRKAYEKCAAALRFHQERAQQ